MMAFRQSVFRYFHIGGAHVPYAPTHRCLLEFFRFRFRRFRPYYHNGNVILHQAARFHPNRATCDEVVVS